MSSIASRLAKLERTPRASTEDEKAFWEGRLPLLSDHQLNRLETLYLKICDHPKAGGGEAWMTWVEAMGLLDPTDRNEMEGIFAAMGIYAEAPDL